ncbi:MAG TPA: hypothetical protein VMZ27_14855 [Candidatus Saccharimonadales bacterium]|nr:hypothetical protein [Candidatus Saccharimonadales bacterium]
MEKNKKTPEGRLEDKIKHLARRASELALNRGRPAEDVTDADVTWAARELEPMEISSPVSKPGPRGN